MQSSFERLHGVTRREPQKGVFSMKEEKETALGAANTEDGKSKESESSVSELGEKVKLCKGYGGVTYPFTEWHYAVPPLDLRTEMFMLDVVRVAMARIRLQSSERYDIISSLIVNCTEANEYMKLELLELDLESFKNYRKFSFAPNGRSMDIFGRNHVGKTPLADAYFWLLFGRDTLGKVRFACSSGGRKWHSLEGLSASVTGKFRKDGTEEFTLQRTYKQKFSRKKGDAERSVTGNTTDFLH